MCLGVPGRVIAIEADRALLSGTVDFAGTRREVCLAYVPEVKVGDHVVVHVGFAISVVDEAEAAYAWALLEQITDLEVGPDDRSLVSPGPDGPMTERRRLHPG